LLPITKAYRRSDKSSLVSKRRYFHSLYSGRPRATFFLRPFSIFFGLISISGECARWLNLVTPSILLLFTFLLGAGAAFTAPAWQSVVPQLVPKQDLAAAVASNGVGVNEPLRGDGRGRLGRIASILRMRRRYSLHGASSVLLARPIRWRSDDHGVSGHVLTAKGRGPEVHFAPARRRLDIRALCPCCTVPPSSQARS
jgi:hypothetical protein